MVRENLLFYQVAKIIYENGTKYLIADETEGFDRIRTVLSGYLSANNSEPSSVTVADFRKIFKTCWDDVLDDLVPYEAQARVSSEIKTLVF